MLVLKQTNSGTQHYLWRNTHQLWSWCIT